MKIKMKEIPIRELIEDYEDSAEAGVVGFGGQLNIRPAYQREFIYKDKQRDEVIRTIKKNFPLNVMYWIVTNENGNIDLEDKNFDLKNPKNHYELLDGQQRTVSICQYVNGDYSIDFKYFHNLTQTEKDQILDYKIMVYICQGNDKEQLDWFRIINIAGEKLTDQELRNAVYTGTWLTDAKKHFSKTGCPAYNIANNYMNGSTIRQEYLETAIRWKASAEEKEIDDYMGEHQNDANAQVLWTYFQNVINWIKVVFPTYRKEMKGLEWGILYNTYKDKEYDPTKLEKRIVELMEDEDVTNFKGIYEFLLGEEKDEKTLHLRAFTDKQKRAAYEKQKHLCPLCEKAGDRNHEWKFEEMQGDHIKPWSKGGHTTDDNLQMLCRKHNNNKSND